MCLTLDGVFAFALIYGDEFMVARDPIGVKQLYWGTDSEGRKLFRFGKKKFFVKYFELFIVVNLK